MDNDDDDITNENEFRKVRISMENLRITNSMLGNTIDNVQNIKNVFVYTTMGIIFGGSIGFLVGSNVISTTTGLICGLVCEAYVGFKIKRIVSSMMNENKNSF